MEVDRRDEKFAKKGAVLYAKKLIVKRKMAPF